ncbi:COG1470 family protein, partial [Nonomuraea aridisoli]
AAEAPKAPKAPDGHAVTIRLVESTGLGSRAQLSSSVLPLDTLIHSDLLERPGAPAATLDLNGFEIATYLTEAFDHLTPTATKPGPAPAPAETSPATLHTAAETTSPPTHTGAETGPLPTHPGAEVGRAPKPAEAEDSPTPAHTGAEVGRAPVPAAGHDQLDARSTAGHSHVELGPTVEQAQPVYSRYWLHNKGPAPLGYLPISITVGPGLVASPEGPFEVEVVLSSHLTDEAHEGVVDIRVPDGWSATPARRPYRLAPDGHLCFPVTVQPASGAALRPGLHFVAARTHAGGQLVEDVTTVAIGDGPELPVAGPPPESAIHGTTSAEARPTGLSVTPATDALSLRPGDRTSLGLRLTNTTADEIRGETQLASPWGTWAMLPQVIQGFTVPAGETIDVAFPVNVPADAPAGHAWAMAKVMWFGRCQYSPAIRLEVTR